FLHQHGAEVHLQPTVGHRHLAGPLVATLSALGVTLAAGLVAPLPAIALFLGLAWGAIRDVDGGCGWFRRMLPRRPGWVAEAVLTPPDRDAPPTVVVWLPVVPQQNGPLRSTRAARVLVLGLVALGAVGALAVLLHDPLGVPGVELLAAGCAALFVVAALLAGAVLRLRRPAAAEADLAGFLRGFLETLRADPPPRARIILLVGSEGATWYDDLGVWLANRLRRYGADRTVLLALQPAPSSPLGVVTRDGLLRHHRPPPALLDALSPCRLPPVDGRTGALRAARHRLSAIGIQGPVLADPDRVGTAVRCLSSMLTAEHA
ncbi:MAG: hypothetical protein D6798_17850, partial [Deltaproteobacteria bacterium]